MKHQLDATMCRFYFCSVTLHVSGEKRPSSGVFKTSTAATGTCVIVAGKSSHLLIRAGTECYDARKHKINILIKFVSQHLNLEKVCNFGVRPYSKNVTFRDSVLQ